MLPRLLGSPDRVADDVELRDDEHLWRRVLPVSLERIHSQPEALRQVLHGCDNRQDVRLSRYAGRRRCQLRHLLLADVLRFPGGLVGRLLCLTYRDNRCRHSADMLRLHGPFQ